MFLLQLRALHKFHTIEGGNTRDEITSLLLFFSPDREPVHRLRLQVIESPHAPDQISFFAFHSFLVEV